MYLNGVRIAALNEEGTAAYFLTDQVDSVAHVLDEGAHTLSRMQYEPYGETLVQRGTLDFAPKYNSQELDRETNFYFYNARYYDPEIARFTSADTVIDGVGNTQGWNRFAYVKGNPIGAKDPTGHEGEYDVNVRSFIPGSSIDFPFPQLPIGTNSGDNRSYSTENKNKDGSKVTSRIRVKYSVDMKQGKVSRTQLGSNETKATIGPFKYARTSAPTTKNYRSRSLIGNKTSTLAFSGRYAAGNPTVPGAPDIDVSYGFVMRRENGKSLTVNTSTSGDGFPANEAFIGDRSGSKILLGGFTPPADAYPGNRLFPAIGGNSWYGNRQMIDSSVTINLNEQNLFRSVQVNGKAISIEQWNQSVRNSR